VAAEAQLREIGLDVVVRKQNDDMFNSGYYNPGAHVAMRMDNWTKDFPSASTFFPILLSGANIGVFNESMAGATAAQLRKYGYAVRSVPNVDSQMAACEELVFDAQTRCWARLDQYLSEQVVPWIPLTQEVNGWLFSPRVARFTVDASIGTPMPALDNIQLEGTPSPPMPSASSPPSPISRIPDGVYRVTVSLADIVQAGGAKDDAEDTGTFTIIMRGGQFRWHQRGDVSIFNPIAVGRYEGKGRRVRFDLEQPYGNAASLSPLTWRLDGDNLVFTLPGCMGPAVKDPAFCGFQKALFVAHPWERVTEFSGGPF
jgi:hypothetical protein